MRFSELEGARVGVWGAGREITSFARQLQRLLPGAAIDAVIFDGPAPVGALSTLNAPGARVLDSAELPGSLPPLDVVVRSPGVSIHRPEMGSVTAAGVPVVTATGLWLAEHGPAGVIAVTGTKGKSTTAALTHRLATAAGASAQLAGNIGAPALDLLGAEPAEVTVLELSSYQIADLSAGADTVLFTNLYREHTDWHGTEEAYRADKLRLMRLPGVRQVVVNGRDASLRAAADGLDATMYGVADGWDLDGDSIERAGDRVMSARDLPLVGEHNALNLCGALAALEAFGLRPPDLPEALSGFAGLEHRLERVPSTDGRVWVNDSISTTPESALAALASFPGREIVLIAGGQDRGQDHAALAAMIASIGASVIGVPSTGAGIASAVRAAGVPSERALEAPDLESAARSARALSGPGAVIVLSPAAPSYDFYVNFEERGERFRALARGD